MLNIKHFKYIGYGISAFIILLFLFFTYNKGYQKGYQIGFQDGLKSFTKKTDTLRIIQKDTLRIKEIQIRTIKGKTDTVYLDRKFIFKEPFEFLVRTPVFIKSKNPSLKINVGFRFKYPEKTFSPLIAVSYKKFSLSYSYEFPKNSHSIGLSITLKEF